MTTESEHQIQLDKVRFYYNTAQKYYENAWYYLDRGLGLHYGLWFEGVNGRIEAISKENEVLATLAKVKKNDLVLDAGAGVGGSGIWLAKNIGCKTVPLNIVEKQLRRGHELAEKYKVKDKLGFTEADYHVLPFADSSFDVFWSLESIEHSDNLLIFLSEAYRVLKPGGRIVIAGTFQGDKKPTSEQEYQLSVGARCAGAFNDFRSAKEVSLLLNKVGFEATHAYDHTPWVMKSAKQMKDMCKVGLPFAKFLNSRGIVTDVMVDNTAWGIYQEGLFREGVTSYNILFGQKS